MISYADFTPGQIRHMLRDPNIAEYTKAKLQAHLDARPPEQEPRRRAKPEPVPTAPLGGPVHLVVSWAFLASDNMRKTGAGKIVSEETRQARRRYRMALAGFRERVREQFSGAPTNEPVELHYRLYFPDARDYDVLNFGKLIGDGLKEIIFTDDKWPVLRRATCEAGGVDRNRPRAEIVVRPMGASLDGGHHWNRSEG